MQSCAMRSNRQFEGSGHASLYAKFRPLPPPSIMDQIIKFRVASPPFGLTVDVGCGSGQFTRLLLPVSTSVIATDCSETQVEQAKNVLKGDNCRVMVSQAETIEVDERTVDLVSVCQALHWFDTDKFYKEVERVLVPGGILAVVGYHFTRPSPSMPACLPLTEAMEEVYSITKPYWSSRRALVDSAYKTIPMANFKRVERFDEEHYTEIEASLADWSGYIRSWSGYQNFIKEKGKADGEKILKEFEIKCAGLLKGNVHEIDSIMLQLRTRYWVILYQK